MKPQLPPQAAPWPTHQQQPQQAPPHVWSSNFLHHCYLPVESWERWNLPSPIPWRCWFRLFQNFQYTLSIFDTIESVCGFSWYYAMFIYFRILELVASYLGCVYDLLSPPLSNHSISNVCALTSFQVLSRAIASDLENSNVDGAYRETIDPLWADRGLEASTLLSSWCQAGSENIDFLMKTSGCSMFENLVICSKSRFKFCQEASLAPVRNLSRIFVALDPAALKIVDNSGLRPLHTLLQALDKGLPSWWNESYWGDSAGGPDWEIPVPTTSTATRTTTRTQDLESLLCRLA